MTIRVYFGGHRAYDGLDVRCGSLGIPGIWVLHTGEILGLFVRLAFDRFVRCARPGRKSFVFLLAVVPSCAMGPE